MDDSDMEIAALATVAEALEPLDIATRRRVLDWAAARFVVGLDPDGKIMLSLAEALVETEQQRRNLEAQMPKDKEAVGA